MSEQSTSEEKKYQYVERERERELRDKHFDAL